MEEQDRKFVASLRESMETKKREIAAAKEEEEQKKKKGFFQKLFGE